MKIENLKPGDRVSFNDKYGEHYEITIIDTTPVLGKFLRVPIEKWGQTITALVSVESLKLIK